MHTIILRSNIIKGIYCQLYLHALTDLSFKIFTVGHNVCKLYFIHCWQKCSPQYCQFYFVLVFQVLSSAIRMKAMTYALASHRRIGTPTSRTGLNSNNQQMQPFMRIFTKFLSVFIRQKNLNNVEF